MRDCICVASVCLPCVFDRKEKLEHRTNAKTVGHRCNLGGGPGSAPRCDMRGAACNH